MLVRLSISLFVALVGMAGCFVEPAQPSTFRFKCSKTDECPEGEVCSDGLCQQPCGAELEACGNATACLNGFCSSICPLDQDVCPTPQECVTLPQSEDEDEPPTSGICTILCDDDEHPCAEGQFCFIGFCLTQCMTNAECASGEACTEMAPGLSICVPSWGGGGGFP